jgi:YD repeat-containing protein
VTWNDYDGVHPWGTPGGDYQGSTAAGTFMNGSTANYRAFDVTGIAAGWVSGAEDNHGVILKRKFENTDTMIAFKSSTSPDEGHWPKLTVDYTPASAPAPDGVGDRRFFTYDAHDLTDRMSARVNVANGNLLVDSSDLSIGGVGVDVTLHRYYNSLAPAGGVSDPAGLGSGWVAGDGPSTRLEFPSPGRVVYVDGSGYRVRFDVNAAGGYVRAEPGLDARLRHDTADGTYRLEWYDGQRTVFDDQGRLVSREDRAGNSVAYSYNTEGRLDHLVDTQGRRVDFAYSSGLLKTVTDVAAGRIFEYDYAQFAGDPSYRLAEAEILGYGIGSDPTNVNAETHYDYDSAGRLVQISDPLGRVTRIGYDGASGRVASLTRVTAAADDVDPTTTFTYGGDTSGCADPKAVAVSTVDGPRTDVADVTSYCSDAFDRVVATIDAAGHRRGATYTPNSNVAT